MESSALNIFTLLGILCAMTTAMHIQKEDICLEVKAIMACDELESEFKSNNCTSPRDCLAKDKMDECFHGLLYNGTKYPVDNQCLQFYCNCFEGGSHKNTSTNSNSENHEMQSGEIQTDMGNSTHNFTGMNEENEIEMMHSDMSQEETARNFTGGMRLGKYVRPDQSGSGNLGSDTQNQRDGSRKPDYSTTRLHETTTQNIYHTEDTAKNLHDQENHIIGSGSSTTIFTTSLKLLSTIIFLSISFTLLE